MNRVIRQAALLFFLAAVSLPAFAAVTHVASTSTGGYSNRLRITAPRNVAAGDVLLVKVGVRRQTSGWGTTYDCGSMPAVSGWTLLRCDEDGVNHAQAIYWKYAVNGDARRRFTWTFGSANAYYAGGMSVYRGADPTDPIDGHAGLVTTYPSNLLSGTNLTVVAPSVTTTVSGDMIVALFGAHWATGAMTQPAGMTERYERGTGTATASGLRIEASDQIQAAAGATGNRNGTSVLPGAYAAPYRLIGQQVAIRPTVVFDHIRILHDGTGTTCTQETVTLQACADAACSALYTTGPVTATLAPTDAASTWSANPVTFTGSATLTFAHTAAGTVSFGVSAATPLPSASPRYRCFVGATETCNMTIASGGFTFNVPDLTACKPSPSVTITATQSSGGSCGAAFSGTKTVNFWSSYVNPTTGTKSVSINGTTIATASPGTPVSLTFDALGKASFTVTYPDAGSMRINASYPSASLSGSDGFIALPVGLAVSTASSCAAGDVTCPVFAKAGDPFAMTVKAACWQSDTDTNLADNPVTPNFRMNGIALDSAVVAPAGGSDGALGTASIDMVAANAGVVTIPDQSQAEVGVFTVTATPTPGGYFGLTVPAATSANIGRFIPDHFNVDPAPVLTNRSDIVACAASTFTYLGEPLRLDFALIAENADGDATTNYEGAFGRLGLAAASAFAYGALSGTTNLSSRLDLTLASTGAWDAGVGTVSGTLALKRAAAPDGPWPATGIGIAPVDPDGVALDPALLDMNVDGAGGNEHARLGSTAFRYGRLRMDGAYGSELLGLPMPLSLQYWNQYAFVAAADDTCTSVTASNVALSFPVHARNNLTACETSALVQVAPLRLTLSAPGAGNNGWADATLNLGATGSGTACVGGAAVPATGANLPYLRYDWNSAVAGDEDPSGRATFGVYRGGGSIVDLREAH